jgi:uncharacterized membrane protein
LSTCLEAAQTDSRSEWLVRFSSRAQRNLDYPVHADRQNQLAITATNENSPARAPVFIGCDYTVASQEEFVDAAGEADAMADSAEQDMEEMLERDP